MGDELESVWVDGSATAATAVLAVRRASLPGLYCPLTLDGRPGESPLSAPTRTNREEYTSSPIA